MKKLKLAIRFLITLSLVLYLSTKIDFENLLRVIKKVDIFMFSLASLLYIVSSYISTLRWRFFIPQSYYLKKSSLFSLYMIGAFFNQFLPGIMGGDVVKVYYLRRFVGVKDAAISVFIDRYIGFFALLFLGFFFFSIFWWKMPSNWLVFSVPLMFLGFLLVSLMIFKIGRIPIVRELKGFIFSFTKRELIQAFLYSLIIQSIVVLSVYLIFLSLRLQVSFFELFVYLTIIITLTTLPISISGIGIREWAFVLFFGNHVGNENAVALSILWFFSVLLASAWGAVEYLRFKESLYMHDKKNSL